MRPTPSILSILAWILILATGPMSAWAVAASAPRGVYRCGDTYQHVACADSWPSVAAARAGILPPVGSPRFHDPRSAEQQRQRQAALLKEQQALAVLEKERLQRELRHGAVFGVHANLGPAAAPGAGILTPQRRIEPPARRRPPSKVRSSQRALIAAASPADIKPRPDRRGRVCRSKPCTWPTKCLSTPRDQGSPECN